MQGLGRIRFFGLQIRFYLLFYLRVRCLFCIALELCNYRTVFTYQIINDYFTNSFIFSFKICLRYPIQQCITLRSGEIST